MKYTPRLEHAIRIASEYHDGQYRKDVKKLPYVSHVFTVATIVSNYTNDEDVLIAALLHDSIEDTKLTPEEVQDLFGERVLSLIQTVSEPKDNPSWKERKDTYLAQLESGPDEALLISVADKLHNINSKHRLAEENGKEILNEYKQYHADYIWFHGEILKLAERIPQKELVEEYRVAFQNEQELLES